MPTTSHTDVIIGSCSSQLPKKTVGDHMERQSDIMRNEDIRKKTGLQKLEHVLKEKRVRWLGHVLRIEDSRIHTEYIRQYIFLTEWLREKSRMVK